MAAPADLDAWRQRLDRWAADPVVYPAVKALAQDGAWREALDRSRAAIRAKADRDRVIVALAEGALEGGRADRCVKALEQITPEGERTEVVRALRVRALEADGRSDEAVRFAEGCLLDDPDDGWAAAWLRTRRVPWGPSAPGLPMGTLRRVEALAAQGYLARALRLARRIALAHPDDPAVAELRMRLADRVADLEPEEQGVLHGLPFPELPQELL